MPVASPHASAPAAWCVRAVAVSASAWAWRPTAPLSDQDTLQLADAHRTARVALADIASRSSPSKDNLVMERVGLELGAVLRPIDGDHRRRVAALARSQPVPATAHRVDFDRTRVRPDGEHGAVR